MPTLTRWFIKSALLYFVAALSVGVMLALHLIVELPPLVSAFSPVYFHLLMVGWLTQLIFGVAYWMFPRFSPALPRGPAWLGWTTYALLNIGLLLRVIAEPLVTVRPNPIAGWGVAASAVLQWLAGMAFVINAWNRVREK
jgi:hypothetical protein